MKKKINILSLS